MTSLHEGQNDVASDAPAADAAPARPTRPRLLTVLTRMDVGGVPDHVIALYANIADRYELWLACREVIPQHAARLEQLGVRVELIDFARAPSPLRDIRALIRLVRFIRRHRFDILHSHMSKGALLGGLAGRIARVPIVVHTAHGFGWLALRNPLLRGLFWVYDRTLYALTLDRLFIVSEIQRQRLIADRMVKRERTNTIFNGIDADAVRLAARTGVTRAELGVPEDAVLVVAVNRLVAFKAVHTLIDAVHELGRDAGALHVVVAGDGDLRPQLERQIAALGLQDRVRLIGWRDDAPRIIALADVFALSSVAEGMPLAIMRAMALGKPVVANAVDGVPELVVDGETGLLVPPRDPVAFASALRRMIEDPEMRRRFGEAGRRRVDALFTQRSMAETAHRLYRELLDARSGSAASG
jgi:glycosyltransferase involved in cell wall biosynthesis